MVMLETLKKYLRTGWTEPEDMNEVWTYASADDPTYTFTISGDKTSKYSVGMKIKLTQTTVKYFIITAISYSSPNTTVTVYGGTDYDLTNATITSPFVSTMKSPYGFPTNPTKWSVTITDTTRRQQANPTAYAWYNIGSLSIVKPIGKFLPSVICAAGPSGSGGNSEIGVSIAFSTSTTSVSDNTLMGTAYMRYTGSNANSAITQTINISKPIPLSQDTKTTYYLIVRSNNPGATDLSVFGTEHATQIILTCAYL